MSVGCRLSAADWWDFHASHASPGERTSWGAGRWERSLWQFGRRQLGGTEGCMEDGRCSWWAVSGRMQRTSVSSSAEWGWGRPSCFTGAVDHAWHSASSWETPAVRPRHADGLSLAAAAALTPHAHPLPPPPRPSWGHTLHPPSRGARSLGHRLHPFVSRMDPFPIPPPHPTGARRCARGRDSVVKSTGSAVRLPGATC